MSNAWPTSSNSCETTINPAPRRVADIPLVCCGFGTPISVSRRSSVPVETFVLAVGVFFGEGAAAQPNSASASSSPPNILVLVADDAGWGDFGAYGNSVTLIRTLSNRPSADTDIELPAPATSQGEHQIVRSGGFEPPACGTGNRCSVRLSYERR